MDIEKEYGIPRYAASNLMTSAEFKLYKLLDALLSSQLKCINKRVAINCKVRLADLFKVNGNQRDSRSLFNQISSKHIDFTIIDPENGKVICLVELNDSYHLRADRAKRDEFIMNLCYACGVKIFWIRDPINQINADTLEDISYAVLRYFSPRCKLCGGLMEPKRSRHPKNLGHWFYGCTNKYTPLQCGYNISIG